MLNPSEKFKTSILHPNGVGITEIAILYGSLASAFKEKGGK